MKSCLFSFHHFIYLIYPPKGETYWDINLADDFSSSSTRRLCRCRESGEAASSLCPPHSGQLHFNNMTDSPESKSHSHINYLPDLTLQFKGQKELNFKNIALAHSKPRLVPIDSWLMHVMYGNNINNVLFRSSQQTQSTRNSLYSIPPPDFKFKPGVSGEKLLWSLKVWWSILMSFHKNLLFYCSKINKLRLGLKVNLNTN